jgi:Icc protein
MAQLTTQKSINIVQITDPHLYDNAAGTLLQMNTQDSLDRVIELVQEMESGVDLLLATGDIAQDASAEAYNNFLRSVKVIDAPLRWIPGNHDSAREMDRAAQGTDVGEKSIKLSNWLILLLDTSIEEEVHGRLAESELEFLESSLDAAQQDSEIDHCLICLHHNPVQGSAGWMKDVGLVNDDQLFEVVDRFSNISGILYGHIHQDLDFMHGNVRCLCSPSTCIQFKADVSGFELDKVNPGYRSLQLLADGSIETEVRRVGGYTLEADYNSTGY